MIRPTWPLARFMRVLCLALVVLGCFAQPARAAADTADTAAKSERVVIHSIRVIRPSATWCGRGGSGCACSCPPRPMKSRADAERDLLGRKCACGAKLTGPFPDSAWSTIALGEKSVTVGRAECGCGVTTRRYFVVEGGPPGQV